MKITVTIQDIGKNQVNVTCDPTHGQLLEMIENHQGTEAVGQAAMSLKILAFVNKAIDIARQSGADIHPDEAIYYAWNEMSKGLIIQPPSHTIK